MSVYNFNGTEGVVDIMLILETKFIIIIMIINNLNQKKDEG